MKTIVNGLTVTIEECAGGFTARASFGTEKIIELSATSSRDYAAVAALFDACKHQAIENLKELPAEGKRTVQNELFRIDRGHAQIPHGPHNPTGNGRGYCALAAAG